MKRGPHDDVVRLTDEKQLEKCLARRHRLHDQGLCVECGTKIEPGREGHWRCLDCSEYMKEYERVRRETLISKGICVTCGRNKARWQRLQCEKCAERIAENRRERLKNQNEK